MATTTNIKTRIQLRNDQLSNWNSSENPLLRGEVALARLSGELSDKFEVRIGTGDKTWKQLSSSNFMIPAENVVGLNQSISELSTSFYEVETKDALDALTDVTNGSIGVVRELIAVDSKDPGKGEKREKRTAYYYDSKEGKWQALDGNYSAEDVYFANDLVLTKNFGKYTVPAAGYYTLSCKGLNVKELFEDAFAVTESAGKQNPSPTWTQPGSITAKEVGEYNTSLGGMSFKYTDGKYTSYNNNLATGNVVSSLVMTRTAAQVEDLGDATKNVYNLTAINDTLSITTDIAASTTKQIAAESSSEISVQFTDSAIDLATYTGTAKYKTSTAVPKNNLGVDDPSNTVPGGTWSYNGTAKVTQPAGYRKAFWGYRLGTDGDIGTITLNGDKERVIDFNGDTKITSDQIRSGIHAQSETSSGPGWTKKDTWITKFTVPAGSRQIIFAVPHSMMDNDHKYIKMTNTTLGNYVFPNGGKVSEEVIEVEGANGFDAIKYDVWAINPVADFAAAAEYTVTFSSKSMQ